LENEEDLQKGLIITDDISVNPILDFKDYRDAIANIIINSYPKFTIGIFGDWGTGKTTLMESVDKKLSRDKDIIRVKFETWRYEREDQFALVPLLKSIAFALPDDDDYSTLKQRLKRGATSFLKKTPDILSSFLSQHFGEATGKITDEFFESLRKEFNSRIELLSEIDRDTLYYDGFEDIRKELLNIRIKQPSFRIVVFVDDLDRCSPRKTLEILESIKVFLGMDGFIYVLGLSHVVVSKLIEIEYEKSGIKGDQYIKKMIQIPITLPKWDKDDISKLITYLIDDGIIAKKYQNIISKNINIISTAIENNPREIKRFLNNFIVASEIFKNGIRSEELLILQAIQLRWDEFYHLLVKLGKEFILELKKYCSISNEDRGKIITEKTKVENYNDDFRILLQDYTSDTALWDFLKNHLKVLEKIENWKPYRRAVETVTDIPDRVDDKILENLRKATKISRILEVEVNKLIENLQLSDGQITTVRKLLKEQLNLSKYLTSLHSRHTSEELVNIARSLRSLIADIEGIVLNWDIKEDDRTRMQRIFRDYYRFVSRIVHL
jgi:predicted KAP-like P-loop ATPase